MGEVRDESGRLLGSALVAIRTRPYGVIGGVALTVGFFIAVLVALGSGSEEAPSAVQSAVLVIASGSPQIAGAWLFKRQGSQEPLLNRGVHRVALRALSLHTQQVGKLLQQAEAALDSGTPASAKAAVQELSVGLSYIQEGLEGNLQDWAALAPSDNEKEGTP